MSIAVADRNVDVLGDEVDLLGRGGDAQVDLWVGRSKASEPVHEPFCAEIRRGADGQYARGAVLQQTVGPHRNPIQRVADDRQVLLAGVGDDEPLAVASEQLEAESRFKRPHLLAYSHLAHTEFFCGPREILATSRCLEGS